MTRLRWTTYDHRGPSWGTARVRVVALSVIFGMTALGALTTASPSGHAEDVAPSPTADLTLLEQRHKAEVKALTDGYERTVTRIKAQGDRSVAAVRSALADRLASLDTAAVAANTARAGDLTVAQAAVRSRRVTAEADVHTRFNADRAAVDVFFQDLLTSLGTSEKDPDLAPGRGQEVPRGPSVAGAGRTGRGAQGRERRPGRAGPRRRRRAGSGVRPARRRRTGAEVRDRRGGGPGQALPRRRHERRTATAGRRHGRAQGTPRAGAARPRRHPGRPDQGRRVPAEDTARRARRKAEGRGRRAAPPARRRTGRAGRRAQGRRRRRRGRRGHDRGPAAVRSGRCRRVVPGRQGRRRGAEVGDGGRRGRPHQGPRRRARRRRHRPEEHLRRGDHRPQPWPGRRTGRLDGSDRAGRRRRDQGGGGARRRHRGRPQEGCGDLRQPCRRRSTAAHGGPPHRDPRG